MDLFRSPFVIGLFAFKAQNALSLDGAVPPLLCAVVCRGIFIIYGDFGEVAHLLRLSHLDLGHVSDLIRLLRFY